MNDQSAIWYIVADAAKRWAQARREVVNLPLAHPDYKTRLNALSEAEDALNKEVKFMENHYG